MNLNESEVFRKRNSPNHIFSDDSLTSYKMNNLEKEMINEVAL